MIMNTTAGFNESVSLIDAANDEKQFAEIEIPSALLNHQRSEHANQHSDAPKNNDLNNNKNDNDNMEYMEYIEHLELSKFKLLKKMHNELMNSNETKLLYFGIVFTMICGILRLLFFSFIGSIIDLLSNSYDSDQPVRHSVICSLHEYIKCPTNQSMVTVFIITLVILSVISSLSKLSQSLLTTFCCNSFIKRLNYLVFHKIIASDLSFFDCRDIRDLRYLLTSDMKHIAKTLYSTENILENFIYFICCITYLFIFNWDITLIIIASFILLLIVSIIYNKKVVKVYKIRKNSFKVVLMTITEMLNYITTIKIFNKEDDETFLYQQCINRAFKFDKQKNNLLYCYRFWITIITYFTILCVVWYGTVASHISIGQIIINLFILLQLNHSIYTIIKLSNKLYPESVDRIIDILNIENIEEKTNKNFIPFNADQGIDGFIEIKHIQFSYPSSSKLVLNDISLIFNPSSTTALIGMNGSGKSSILKLIMKFYSPQKGQLLIDNMDINDYNLSFLHSQIGYIGQNIALFENRTISDNIRFGIKLDQKNYNVFDSKYFDEEYLFFWRQFKSIKQSDIEDAAKIANAHEFIIKLKNGYNTIIGGKNGVKLSEGEKQRIGIARTILLKPKILLLDEAMSHLDSISKHLIQESLDKIIYESAITVIVIAHRLKTVMRADMIYVVHNGRIVQSGNHNQLIQIENGQYFKLNQRETFHSH